MLAGALIARFFVVIATSQNVGQAIAQVRANEKLTVGNSTKGDLKGWNVTNPVAWEACNGYI